MIAEDGSCYGFWLKFNPTISELHKQLADVYFKKE